MINVEENCTLVFKKFPFQWTDSEKTDFLRYFGALEVKCLSSKVNKCNTTFAKFANNNIAEAALQYLHQKEIQGQRLSVEFARAKDAQITTSSDPSRKEVDENEYNREYENFISKLNSWINVANFNLPPPVHLRYEYPSANAKNLTNICRALHTDERFYTQVVHLMNKMNLPCPFMDDFPIESSLVVVDSAVVPERDLSEGESELEEETLMERELVPENRTRKRKRLLPVKAATVDRAVKPTKPLKPTEVFEVAEIQAKKIEVKVSSDLSSLRKAQPDETVEEAKFETLEVPKKIEDDQKDATDTVFSGKVISYEELAATRITPREQRVLAVFKNYQPGIPSCRLYVKNLAKTVVEADLHYIYRKFYKESEEEQGMMFDVRLMQEGRMKGQAFVTLQSIEAAQDALRETNGFVLQGKPMVVAFARSAKAPVVEKPA